MHCSSLSLCSKPFQKKKRTEWKKMKKKTITRKEKKVACLQQIMYDIILKCYRLYTYFISTALYKIWPSLSLSYISSHLQTLFQTNIIPSKQKSPAALKCSTTPKNIHLTAQARKYLTSNRDTNDLGLKSILVTNSRLNLARILDHYFSHLNGFLFFSARTGNPQHLSLCSKPFQKKREQKRTKWKKMKKKKQ